MFKIYGIILLLLFACISVFGRDFAITTHYDTKYEMNMEPYAAGPNAGIEYSLTRNMTGIIVGSYHEWDETIKLNSLGYKMDRSYNSFSTMIGIKYNVYQSQAGLENYIIALGGMNITNTVREIVEQDKEDPTQVKIHGAEWDDNSPIFGIGLGLSFPVANNLAFDVQARHHISTNSDDYNQLLVGFKYMIF